AAGLEREAARMEKAQAEARAAEEKAAAAAEAEARANSFGRLVKIVLIAGSVLGLLLLAAAALVFAEDRHVEVVVLDLCVSMAPDEFTKNVQAGEGLITRLEPETRLVVLAVTEASFSAPSLFVETSPKAAGRFGEYLGSWRTKVVRDWRQVA